MCNSVQNNTSYGNYAYFYITLPCHISQILLSHCSHCICETGKEIWNVHLSPFFTTEATKTNFNVFVHNLCTKFYSIILNDNFYYS
jgi:hypothetical protein